MRNSLIVSSLLLCLITFSYAEKNSKRVPSLAPVVGDGVIARVNGKKIMRSDIEYDIQARYNFELHKLEVKLFREQRSQLNTFVDQTLLESEAAKRKISPSALFALVTAKAEKGTKAIEANKERLFQEFIDDIKKRSGKVSGKTIEERIIQRDKFRTPRS